MNFHVHQVISRYLVFYVFRKIKIGPPGQLLICNARTKNVPWHILAERFLLCRKAVSCKVKNRCQKDNGFPAHFYSVILRLPQMFTVLTIQRVLRL